MAWTPAVPKKSLLKPTKNGPWQPPWQPLTTAPDPCTDWEACPLCLYKPPAKVGHSQAARACHRRRRATP